MGRQMALGPCPLLGSETPLSPSLAVTLDVGSPLSCSFLSVQAPHQPSLSFLVGSPPFSDLFCVCISFLPLHTFPSLLSTIIFPSFSPPTSPVTSPPKLHPKAFFSHWNSSAGKNDWAHKAQLNLCLGTSFRFPFPLPLFPARCKLWGHRHDFPVYLLAHTAHCCSAEL